MKLDVQRRHFLVGNRQALVVGGFNQTSLNRQASGGGGATNTVQQEFKRS